MGGVVSKSSDVKSDAFYIHDERYCDVRKKIMEFAKRTLHDNGISYDYLCEHDDMFVDSYSIYPYKNDRAMDYKFQVSIRNGTAVVVFYERSTKTAFAMKKYDIGKSE